MTRAHQRTELRTSPIVGGAGLVLLLGAVACRPSGPLDAKEQAGLQGALYFHVGALEHDGPNRAHRYGFDVRTSAPVSPVNASSFVYGVDPSGRQLALTIDDDLVIASPDGRGMKRIAADPELDWYPQFSPDGRFIVFESARASFRDLFLVDVASGDLRRLTDNAEGNFDAAWSPKGDKLAFASSRAGQLDVWVMNADGSEARRLTRHAGDSVKPAWSPSGRYIAFISARDGKDDLFVMTSEGESMRKLSAGAPRRGRRADAPHVSRFAWHPTEDRIVYAARAPRASSQIHVVDAVDGASRRLSRPEVDDREPSWSPDGAHIAFASGADHGSEIFVMRADGSRRTRLTSTEGRAWLPRWVRVNKPRSDS